MVQVNAKHFKEIKSIVDLLNKEFPPQNVLSKKIINNKLVNFTATVDPYFCAYIDNTIWWICCADLFVWREACEYLDQFILSLKQVGIKMRHCNIHPVYAGMKKGEAKEGKCFFYGTVSWK